MWRTDSGDIYSILDELHPSWDVAADTNLKQKQKLFASKLLLKGKNLHKEEWKVTWNFILISFYGEVITK